MFDDIEKLNRLCGIISTLLRPKGVYIMLKSAHEKSFLYNSVGGHFEGENPTISTATIDNHFTIQQ